MFSNLSRGRAAICSLVVVVCGTVSFASLAEAVVVSRTDTFYPGQTDVEASSSDIINQSHPFFLNQTDDGNYSPQFSAGPLSTLNNGTRGAASANGASVFDASNTTFTTTFHLNTSANAAGYDISRIQTYTAWPDERVNQSYQVLYSTVTSNPLGTDNVGFALLDGAPLDPISTKVVNDTKNAGFELVITLDISDLSNVNAIQFLVNANAPGRTESAFREFDVFGTATALPVPPAPEPASLLLLAFGSLVLTRRRRR